MELNLETVVLGLRLNITYFQLSKENWTTYGHAILCPGDLILQIFYEIT